MNRTFPLSALVLALALAGCSDSNDDADAPEFDDDATVMDGDTADGDMDADTGDDTGDEEGPDDSDGVANAVGPVPLDEVGQDLLVSLAGFQADELALRVIDLAAAVAAAGEASPLPPSTFETVNGFGLETVVAPTRRSAHTCNAGGQMTVETGRLRDDAAAGRKLLGDYDAFTFEGCRHTGEAGALPAGEYELDGRLDVNAADYAFARGGRSGHTIAWEGFAMSAPGDIRYEVSGTIDEGAYSAANFGTGDSRSVALASYRKRSGEMEIESLRNARVALRRESPNGSNTSSYSLDAEGTYLGPATGGVAVTIETDPILFGIVTPAESEPFGGQVRMRAADGGELFLSGNPTSAIDIAPGALLVDVVALRPDGESTSADAVPLIDLRAGGLAGDCFIADVGADASSEACGGGELP